MTASFTESAVDDAALAWLDALCREILHGPRVAAGEPAEADADSACGLSARA